jgi:hypothetical protein
MAPDAIIENNKNQEYIDKNLGDFKKYFLDRFIVVHKQEVVASFKTFKEASEFGVAQFGINDPFLIYHVEDKKPVNFIMHTRPDPSGFWSKATNLAVH